MNIRKKIGPVVSATGIFILVVVGAMCYIFVWNGDLLQVNAMWIILASAVPSFIIFVVGVLLRVPPQGAGKGVHPGDEPQSLTASSASHQVRDSAGNQPWEKVPDKGYDRKMLELWHIGFSAREIGKKVDRSEHTIRNRLSELRQDHGEKIVPRRRPG